MCLGAMTNCMLVTSETWINEIVDDANRGRLMGLYNALLAAAVAMGPLVIPAVGIQGWTPFLVGACFIALAALPLLFTGPYRLFHPGRILVQYFFLHVAGADPGCRRIVVLHEGNGGEFIVAGVRRAQRDGPGRSRDHAYRYRRWRSVPAHIPWDGWRTSSTATECSYFAAWVALAGAVLLPYAMDTHILLWPLLFAWGGAFAGMYTAVLTIIGQRFRGRELVTANVSLGLLWGVGSMVWPPLTGVAMDIWDPEGFPLVLIAASLVFVLFAAGQAGC